MSILAWQAVALSEQVTPQRTDGTTPVITGDISYRIEDGDGVIVKAASGMVDLGGDAYGYSWTPAADQALETYYAKWSMTADGRVIDWRTFAEIQVLAADTYDIIGVAGSAGLCTRAQVKADLGIPAATTSQDDLIDSLIVRMTATVKAKYGREFVGQTTATRTLAVNGRLVDLSPYDLRSVSASGAVTLNPTDDSESLVLVANTDYLLKPIGGDKLTGTYTYLKLADDLDIASSDMADHFDVTTLSIAGDWGIWAGASTVAADVNDAAIKVVKSWLDRGSESVADIDGIGEPRAIQPGTARGWAIPSSAHETFQRYSRYLGVY